MICRLKICLKDIIDSQYMDQVGVLLEIKKLKLNDI